nr:class F sortase [Petropleomorpha daqingensis]
MQIPDIGVDATVEPRGTVRYDNPFTGQEVDGYGVPRSMWTTAWWSDGPQPGSGSMAVVLGHAQAAHGAVFDRLADLRPGDRVDLVDASGAVLHLQVLGKPVTGLDKSTSALADTLNGHPDGADLALVTCGGDFDRAAGASEDNEVVFATVV